MRSRSRPLASWSTRRLDPRPPATASRETGVDRDSSRSSFGCVARRGLAGAGDRAVPTAHAGHVRGRAAGGAFTDVTGSTPSRAARSPASRAARPRRRATRGFLSLAMRQGFSTADAPARELRRATRAARWTAVRARRRRTRCCARAPPVTAAARSFAPRVVGRTARHTANRNSRPGVRCTSRFGARSGFFHRALLRAANAPLTRNPPHRLILS